jgi:hypothetical protein
MTSNIGSNAQSFFPAMLDSLPDVLLLALRHESATAFQIPV